MSKKRLGVPGFYRGQEVEELLQITKSSIQHLRKIEVLPFNKVNDEYLYPCSFIDQLRALRLQCIKQGYTAHDVALAELWYLRTKYYERGSSSVNGHKKSVYRPTIVRCDALIANHRIMKLETFCELMRDFATPYAITHWAHRGTLVTVRIGGVRYLSCVYAKYIHTVFKTWVTLYIAAVKLDMPYATIASQCYRGFFVSYKMPDGIVRAELEKIHAVQRQLGSSQLVGFKETRNRLDISSRSLSGAAEKGRIESVKVKGVRFFKEETVSFWEKRFTTINPGFEWLHRESQKVGGMRLLSTKQVAKQLGLPRGSQHRWYIQNLLPFYSPNFGTVSIRSIPARYVYGLRRYATGNRFPMTRKTGQEYRDLCIAKQMIV